MTVKGNHPLAEIIARKLFSIETVPTTEQKKMVSRAVKSAVEYHEAEINKLKEQNKEMLEALKETNKKIQDSCDAGYPINVIVRNQKSVNKWIIQKVEKGE